MTHDAGYWLQQSLNILQLAGFYMPLAAAFALLQGITRRVFLSFGDLAMYGSFAAIYTCFAALLRGDGDTMAAAIALPIAILCTGAFGYIIARAFFGTTLLRHAQAFMIASVGMAIVIHEAMRLNSLSRDVWVPPLLQGINLLYIPGDFSVKVTAMSGVATLVSLAALATLAITMRYTPFGRQWRACAQSLKLAELCGVNSSHVVAMTFVASSSLAAVSGWMSAISYGGTNASIGLMMGFKAMFASVVGGFGSIKGAIVGAASLAAVEVLWSAAFSTTYRDVAVFAIIIVILTLRPEGIAGLAGQAGRRESEVE
jgi:branched-chain amino acid transport system permease protein